MPVVCALEILFILLFALLLFDKAGNLVKDLWDHLHHPVHRSPGGRRHRHQFYGFTPHHQESHGEDVSDKEAQKALKIFTDAITNYPTGEEGVQAGLLIYKNTVLGGDVLSSQLGGFIHGLELPT